MSDSASIDPLETKTGKSWGAKAAAGDTLNRVPNEAPFIAIWIELTEDGDESIKWSKANLSYRHYSYIAIALMEFAQACVRRDMQKKF